MSELVSKTEDISNGMVDIYRYLEGGSKLSNPTALLLVMCPSEIRKAVSRLEREESLKMSDKARSEMSRAIDKGAFVIKALIASRAITREQAMSVLDDLETLHELVSVKE